MRNDVLQRFRAIIALYCTAATFVIVYFSGASLRDLIQTGSHVIRLNVTESASRRCGSSVVQPIDRQFCRPLLQGSEPAYRPSYYS